MIKILSVIPSSPAAKAGILPGESIVSINSEPVLDEIDYQALIQHPHLEIEVSDIEGRIRQISVAKSAWASLGLQLDETVAMKPRHCRNHCVFCFIDQMPPGMRKTLYVKDDDWRLSLMMGNYVTLTNVDDQEFIRILKRKASPLYISVHATDPEVRIRMLRNPNAGNILQRLKDLKNHGICFHTQIVLCPGYNDGKVLEKTIEDLAGLWPATLSVAIVPIGMTKYRDHLSQIPAVDRDLASGLIDSIERCQQKFLKSFGTRFVFLSDEFYCLCGRELPEEETYEDYPQIENGIGMIRQFEEECVSCWEDYCSTPVPEAFSERKEKIIIPTGVSVFPYIKRLAEKYAPAWTETKVIPVKNRYFGESITVTGLIVGKDLIHAVKDQDFDRMLISESMLRENTDRFLDDLTLQEVRNTVKGDIVIVPNHGENFIRALYHLEDENE
ncbi:MAG: DUF512 domain-containing protein [Clostridia bacterium]|nr:DUF512 domain-containing protein [Clostridia bacterium]